MSAFQQFFGREAMTQMAQGRAARTAQPRHTLESLRAEYGQPTPEEQQIARGLVSAAAPASGIVAASTTLSTPATTLLADFAMPAPGADGAAEVGQSSIFWVGQIVFLANIGWLQIVGGSPAPRS